MAWREQAAPPAPGRSMQPTASYGLQPGSFAVEEQEEEEEEEEDEEAPLARRMGRTPTGFVRPPVDLPDEEEEEEEDEDEDDEGKAGNRRTSFAEDAVERQRRGFKRQVTGFARPPLDDEEEEDPDTGDAALPKEESRETYGSDAYEEEDAYEDDAEAEAEDSRAASKESRAYSKDSYASSKDADLTEKHSSQAPAAEAASDPPAAAAASSAGVKAPAFSLTPEAMKAKIAEFEEHEEEHVMHGRMRKSADAAAQKRKMADVDRFIAVMKEQGNGSLTVAWRRFFDRDGDGELTFDEYCTALGELNFKCDILQLWMDLQKLGGAEDGSGAMSLSALDPEGSGILDRFEKWCKDTLGGPYEVFRAMDDDNSFSLQDDEFVSGLVDLGFFNCDNIPESVATPELALKNLFPLVDNVGKNSIGPEQLLFLERDRVKKMKITKEISNIREKGELSAMGVEPFPHYAPHWINERYKNTTQNGGKHWKMVKDKKVAHGSPRVGFEEWKAVPGPAREHFVLQKVMASVKGMSNSKSAPLILRKHDTRDTGADLVRYPHPWENRPEKKHSAPASQVRKSGVAWAATDASAAEKSLPRIGSAPSVGPSAGGYPPKHSPASQQPPKLGATQQPATQHVPRRMLARTSWNFTPPAKDPPDKLRQKCYRQNLGKVCTATLPAMQADLASPGRRTGGSVGFPRSTSGGASTAMSRTFQSTSMSRTLGSMAFDRKQMSLEDEKKAFNHQNHSHFLMTNKGFSLFSHYGGKD